MAAELIATKGPLQGVVLALDQGDKWTVGRDPQSCQLVVEDPKVARVACVIELTEDGYSVKKVGDASIKVNGRELSQAPLNDGDTLEIGESVFTFYLVEEFEELIFSADDEDEEADEELIAGEGEQFQQFHGEGSLEFSDEDLPEEEPTEQFEAEETPQKREPTEEGFVQESEPQKKKAAEGPQEESFAGEKEPKRSKPTESAEEGFAGAGFERTTDQTKGPAEEGFAEAGTDVEKEETQGPDEEGFAGEKEKDQQSSKPVGPAEEGFAGAGVDPEQSGSKGPKEEGFAQEEGGQPSSDEWEAEEGEAEDFEEDELAEEAALDREDSSQGEDLVSEGSEKEQPPSKERAGEELVSEGADREQTFPEKPSEQLVSEGADREQKTEPSPSEELVSEGADREQMKPEEKPEEELISEGEEVTPVPKEEAASFREPPEEFEKESFSEGDQEEEPLFNVEEESTGVVVDLTPSVRFLLKVIAGPNTGAEFALDMGRSYLIGTEATSCDIVFHDLSVSREHARLYLSESGDLEIEDLGSRNGVLLDQEQIAGKVPLKPSLVVTLGTSAFFVIDREAPQETIVAPAFEAPKPEPKAEEEVPAEEEVQEEEPVAALKEEEPKKAASKPGLSIYVSIVSGLAVLLAICMISLFHTKDLKAPPKDYATEIKQALRDFPSVKYTYSPNSNRLFLVGHVATGIEKDELFYNLNSLSFLKGVDDHVVNDEAVWQEMNILLSKQSDFKGVSMHSPRPAVFVLNGYLKHEKQAADLTDWVNTHFNYINLLENRVVVEETVIEEVSSQLLHNGFGAVAVSFNTGELTLAGYVGSAQSYEFERLVHAFGQLPGVRGVQNFVVIVAPEQQVIDLNQRYPGRFKVTGYSKHGDVSINVVINGHILMRGDTLEGMTLTSIQPNAVFFEKDGLKYKLEYNK